MNSIQKEFIEAQEVLNTFMADENNFKLIKKAGDLIVESFNNKGKLISCGNGGSMCDAMHFAEELSGRFRADRPSLPAMSISDPSYMSCVINDYGADAVFSRYVQGMGFAGDVLIAISTSGNSANVLNAARVAREMGMSVVGLTGRGGGELTALCDVQVSIPWEGYADRVQELHIKVIHAWIDQIERAQ